MKGKRKNRHTKPKQKTENEFKGLTQVWKGMTLAEKKTWFMMLKSSFEFRGRRKKVINDPRKLFMGINMNKLEIGEPIMRVAPKYLEPQIVFNAEVDIRLKGRIIDMRLHLLTKIEEDTKVIVYATPSLTSPSDSINERLYRRIGLLDYKFVSGSSIKKEYLKVFGKIGGVGEEFGFKFRLINKESGIGGSIEKRRARVIKSEIY